MSNNKKHTEMATLDLKRQSKGYYIVEAEGIRIAVSNPFKSNGFGTNKWQLTILNGFDEVLNQWFNTKKECVKCGTNWVIENL